MVYSSSSNGNVALVIYSQSFILNKRDALELAEQIFSALEYSKPKLGSNPYPEVKVTYKAEYDV